MEPSSKISPHLPEVVEKAFAIAEGRSTNVRDVLLCTNPGQLQELRRFGKLGVLSYVSSRGSTLSAVQSSSDLFVYHSDIELEGETLCEAIRNATETLQSSVLSEGGNLAVVLHDERKRFEDRSYSVIIKALACRYTPNGKKG